MTTSKIWNGETSGWRPLVGPRPKCEDRNRCQCKSDLTTDYGRLGDEAQGWDTRQMWAGWHNQLSTSQNPVWTIKNKTKFGYYKSHKTGKRPIGCPSSERDRDTAQGMSLVRGRMDSGPETKSWSSGILWIFISVKLLLIWTSQTWCRQVDHERNKMPSTLRTQETVFTEFLAKNLKMAHFLWWHCL
jgi:hypothetical protein